MKHAIYYFTGTGNSLAIAKDLKNALPESRITEIKPGMSFSAEDDPETIGIVYPVYCWGPAAIVADFVRQLKAPKGTYIYTVASYGGMLAHSNQVIRRLLEANGNELSAGFAIKMPGNFIPMYDIANERKIAKLNRGKAKRVADIIQAVGAKERRPVATSMGFLGRWLSGKVYTSSIKQMGGFAASFKAGDSCTGCGLCAKLCPRGNIELKDGRPVWSDSCEACLACLHWCPVSAIESGSKTAGRKRYHNASVSASELMKR